MKKLIVFAVFAASTVFTVQAQRKAMSPEQLSKLRAARMKQTGGLVEVKGSGHLAVFNAQKDFGEEEIKENYKSLVDFAKGLVIKVEPVKFSIATAAAELRKSGAGAGVFIVDDPSLPMSLVALEESWGMVNVAPLREGNPPKAKYSFRFKKQFIRVSSIVFSGVKSRFMTSPLQSVRSVAELDKTIGDKYGMDTMTEILNHLPEIGVVKDEFITYREACRRGIAASPTNEYQKAIWEKVHAAPKAPMKIEFDPKKGR